MNRQFILRPTGLQQHPAVEPLDQPIGDHGTRRSGTHDDLVEDRRVLHSTTRCCLKNVSTSLSVSVFPTFSTKYSWRLSTMLFVNRAPTCNRKVASDIITLEFALSSLFFPKILFPPCFFSRIVSRSRDDKACCRTSPADERHDCRLGLQFHGATASNAGLLDYRGRDYVLGPTSTTTEPA